MKNKFKILAISSAGGHSVQLNRLRPLFINYNTVFVTSYLNDGQKEISDNSLYNYIVKDFSRNSSCLDIVNSIWQILHIVLKERPSLIVTTGAAPGVIAIIVGKFLFCKTIWIDSIANYEKISLGGRIASLFTDLILTQWEHLKTGKRIKYMGKII